MRRQRSDTRYVAWRLALGAMVLVATACRAYSPADNSASTSTAGAPVSVATLHEVDFDNLAYPVGADGELRRAAGGELEWTDGVGRYSGSVEKTLYGDLDGDGGDEAAVWVSWMALEGAGRYSDVFVYRFEGGRAVQVASVGIGDRAGGGIRSIDMGKGALEVDRLGGDDGLCCPTRVEGWSYYLSSDKMEPDGPPRQHAYFGIFQGDDGPEKLNFLPSTIKAEIDGDAAQRASVAFDTAPGQELTLDLTGSPADGSARMSVERAGRSILAVRAGTSASGTLTDGGRYQLVVGQVGNGPSDYNAMISIR